MKRLLFSSIAIFSLTLLSAQPCRDCSLIDPNAICSFIYDPVCGCDGNTYPNQCIALNFGGMVGWTAGECPFNNVSMCSDLAGLDFGPCDMVLGWASVNGIATVVSGCSTEASNGTDYALAFYGEQEALSFNCLCGFTTNLAELIVEEVRIFPNPANERFAIYYNSTQRLDMRLIDISGRMVKSRQVNSGTQIDINGLDTGLYIVQLSAGDQVLLSRTLVIKP